jgi:hypothetical protein
MTGEAALRLEDPPPVDAAPVSGRSWDFHVQEWRSTDLPVRVKWAFVDYSPYNPT